MRTNAIIPCALIVAVLGGWAARAAEPAPQNPQPETLPPPAVPTSPLPEVLPNTGAAPPGPQGLPPGPYGLPAGSVPDPWITYTRPECCGPVGKNGPIGWEYYLRTGPSLPVSTGILHQGLTTGWMGAIGLRTLFFNAATDAAWTADYGASYTYNNGNKPEVMFDLFGLPVNIREYHRGSFNFALGREWYLLQPAYSPGRHWRFGFDSGGRWGASRVHLNEVVPGSASATGEPQNLFLRRYDVFGAYFIALHSDLEFPISPCSWFIAGIRAEWNYNWTDILPGSRHDLQDVNLLLNFGYRY
jgi:hypothetical protein